MVSKIYKSLREDKQQNKILHLQGYVYFGQFSPCIMICHESVKKEKNKPFTCSSVWCNLEAIFCFYFQFQRGKHKQLSYISRYLFSHSIAREILPCALAIATLLFWIVCTTTKPNRKKLVFIMRESIGTAIGVTALEIMGSSHNIGLLQMQGRLANWPPSPRLRLSELLDQEDYPPKDLCKPFLPNPRTLLLQATLPPACL